MASIELKRVYMEKNEICVLRMPAVAEIYDFAYESLQLLPKSFRTHLKNFVIEVKNFAESNVLAERFFAISFLFMGSLYILILYS